MHSYISRKRMFVNIKAKTAARQFLLCKIFSASTTAGLCESLTRNGIAANRLPAAAHAGCHFMCLDFEKLTVNETALVIESRLCEPNVYSIEGLFSLS